MSTLPKIAFPDLVAERVRGMRGFAMRLTGNDHARADDLMQDTIVNALANESTFVIGTNIDSWLTTIMKNKSYSTYRKKREVEDPEGLHEARLAAPVVESSDEGEAERPADVLAAARGISFTRTLLEQPSELTSIRRMDTAAASIYRQIMERLQ